MLGFGLGQDREGVGNQLGAVGNLVAFAVVALADPAGDMHQITLPGCFDLGSDIGEAHDAVPQRVGLPVVAVAAVIIGGDAHIGDLLARRDFADATDDPELGNILWHDSSFVDVRIGSGAPVRA